VIGVIAIANGPDPTLISAPTALVASSIGVTELPAAFVTYAAIGPAPRCTLGPMSEQQTAGAVAVANEEAVRAWDTVLYERWKSNRKVFVGALEEVTTDAFALFPPAKSARCIDIGCGFGETTRQLAELVGPAGSVLGVDSSPRFIEDARSEAREAGIENAAFETADVQTAQWDPVHDYAFSRMGTQFFASPVPAMRAIRRSLKPGGRLAKICWRRKAESPMWAETEQVVQRFLSRPEEYEADTCGPGPFSLGNPDTTRAILEAAGFEEIELHQRDFEYFMGADMDEAVDSLLAIGPGAELIRLNGDHGESRRGEIAEALRDHYAAWQRPDGSIVGRASVWIVAATNPR
jgi:ubiquinone/menaquinone biosynthesis C-methylase UbiE